MNIKIAEVSSLDKIRTKEDIVCVGEEKKLMLGGETFSYQIAISSETFADVHVSVESDIADHVSVYKVDDTVMDYPYPQGITDEDYITKQPGLMPDRLMPIEYVNGRIHLRGNIATLWVKVDIPRGFKAGCYTVKIKLGARLEFSEYESFCAACEKKIEVLGADLPEQDIKFTQWFHTDCIATVHGVPVYGEAHWELIDKYMKLASELGINMLLTPVITPPLDTQIGKTRPCTQLVGIEKNGESYRFDFSLLDRWVELAGKNGMEYFEISHLFSQWGLEYTPNIWVCENGENVHMFGWHVKANEKSYAFFLAQFLPALCAHLKKLGIFEKCYFHISDEPNKAHLDNYRYARSLVEPYIDGAKIMDAISDVELYDSGLITIPVTATSNIEPFMERKAAEQWVYYCCGQTTDLGNRFMAMPSYRNRILGVQMYKYGIAGFLQWGYNFYFSNHSQFEIDPYITSSAAMAFPSGDSFSVYPYRNGVLPSLRAVIFREALQDAQLCRMAEKYMGREAVLKLIEDTAGMDITFSHYPRNREFLSHLSTVLKEKVSEYI